VHQHHGFQSAGAILRSLPGDLVVSKQKLRRAEAIARLSEALDKLSDNCRAVIWLRRVEGLSQREAAQRLGMNEGALEGYLSRGMRTLAKAVFSDPPAGDPQSDAWEPDDESKRGKRIV